jgi:tetratricopeptide (TPR) repeat protein
LKSNIYHMILTFRMNVIPLILSSFLILSCHAQTNPIHVTTNEQQDIVAKLNENNHLSVERQVTLYQKLKATYPDAYNFENEDQLTMYGYGMLWDARPSDALLIFQLIAEQFPESANAYDSLGEAYFNLGKMDLAIENYQKSLKMNPDNYNAEDYIDNIEYPDKQEATPAELFDKTYTVVAYHNDIDDLANKLFKTHPSIFKFTPKETFEKIIASKKALITNKTTYAMFRWYCNEIIASVNCSHTGMGQFYPEHEMLPIAKRFPLQTAWINERLYITNPLNNHNEVSVRDEILSINGTPVASLIDDIYRHIPSQGLIESTKRLYFNQWSTGLIAYGLGLPDQYSIAIQSQPQPILLQPATEHNDPIEDTPIQDCGDELCLDFIDSSTAILTISTFNFYRWNNYDDFVTFIDHSFEKITDRDIDNLIVDVRRNGGGAPEASIHLLQYLANRSFTYFPDVASIRGGGIREPYKNAFDGQLHFLIDGRGNSTTGHFMAMVKDLNLGTIIGEELGSNQFCTAGQTIFKLNNTRMQFYAANSNNRVSVKDFPDERGILPDHYIYQNIDHYLNKVDVVKNYTLDLISRAK